MTPGATDLCVFAVKRGNIESRFDTEYNHPKYVAITEMLKKNIQTVSFGDVIESIVIGTVFSHRKSRREVDSDVKILSSRNISSIGIDLSNVWYESVSSVSDCIQLAENDLVMAVTGRIGMSAVVTNACLPAYADHQVAVIKLKDGVDPYFASAYLNSSIGLLLSARAVIGSVRKILSSDGIKKIPFPCIPSEKQNLLHERHHMSLCEYTQEMKLIDELSASFENFVSEVCNFEFSDNEKLCFAVRLKDLKSSFDVKSCFYLGCRSSDVFSVCDVCDVIEKRVDISSLGRQMVDRICIGDIADKTIDIGKLRSQLANEMNGTFFEVEDGDILIVRNSPTILNSKISVVRALKRMTVLSSDFLILRCKAGYIPEAVAAVLNMPYYTERISSHINGITSVRSRKNGDDILKLPFPDIRECQETIAFRSVETEKKVSEMRALAESKRIKMNEFFEKELLNCKTEA